MKNKKKYPPRHAKWIISHFKDYENKFALKDVIWQ